MGLLENKPPLDSSLLNPSFKQNLLPAIFIKGSPLEIGFLMEGALQGALVDASNLEEQHWSKAPKSAGYIARFDSARLPSEGLKKRASLEETFSGWLGCGSKLAKKPSTAEPDTALQANFG